MRNFRNCLIRKGMRVDKTKWESGTIDEYCIIQLGTRIVKKDVDEGEFPVYGGGGATFTTSTYNRENAILISRFAISKECTRFVQGRFFLNDSGFTIIPKEDTLLFHYLKWHIFAINDKIYSLGKGIAQKNLDMKRFPFLLLNIPPIDEQQVISSELDSIQTMIDGYKAQLADLDALAQSIFLDMFGDVAINNKSWDIIPMGQLGDLKNGLNYNKGEKGKTLKIIGVGDFQNLKAITLFDNIPSIEVESISQEYLLQNEDIVFVRSNGNKNLVGRCLEVYPNKEEVTFSGFCIRFRKSTDIVNKYLVALLTDTGFKKTHILKSNGIGIQNINQKLLGNLPIPVPPIDLQKRFAMQVKMIERQKELICQQLADAEQLMAERMQYYFS